MSQVTIMEALAKYEIHSTNRRALKKRHRWSAIDYNAEVDALNKLYLKVASEGEEAPEVSDIIARWRNVLMNIKPDDDGLVDASQLPLL